MKPLLIALVISWLAPVLAFDGPNWQPEWQPKKGQHADEMIGPIEHLPGGRAWERLTVWTPKSAPKQGRLPCIIHVYGGGYMNKGCPSTPGEDWLKRGFVVAQPDYMLRAQGTSLTAGWDILYAIRYLRANAERFRIDPERIGLLGISAGGWIAQHICYADDSVLSFVKDNKKSINSAPLMLTHQNFTDIPVRVQAVVSDWGASKLSNNKAAGKGSKAGAKVMLGDFGQITADDPALMTCFKGEPRDMTTTQSSVGILASLGIPAEPVFLGTIKSTHAPSGNAPGKLLDGTEASWHEAVGDYFERHVKNPTQATAPELRPHGGHIVGPTDVRVLSVHGPGTVRYTLDGSEPTKASPVADSHIPIKPGQTLKLIAVKDGLKPSRVTTASFTQGKAAPQVTSKQRNFDLQAEQAFTTTLTATSTDPVAWSIIGQTLVQTGKHFKDLNPWITIDSKTGKLSAPTPRPGTYTVYAIVGPPADNKGKQTQSRSTVIPLYFSVKK